MRFYSILIIITNSLYINKSFTFFELNIFSIYNDIEIMFNAFFNLIFNIKLIQYFFTSFNNVFVFFKWFS